MTTPDGLLVEDAPDFRAPDHTASSTPVDRLKETIGGRGRERLRRPRMESKAPKARNVEPASHPGEFVEALENYYTSLAALALPFDPQCAGIVLEVDQEEDSKHYGKTRARICAESLDAAAQKSEGLRRFLRMLTTGGTWGAVVAAHAPIFLAILSHHTPLMDNLARFQADRFARMMEKETER